jgi:hypothetical protein
MVHAALVRCTRVPEAERHRDVAKHPEWRDERSRELVGLLHLDLMVPGVGIKEAKQLTPSGRINNLIDAWQRKRNFRTCFIKTGVVYTHPPFPIVFLYYYRVC